MIIIYCHSVTNNIQSRNGAPWKSFVRTWQTKKSDEKRNKTEKKIGSLNVYVISSGKKYAYLLV